MAYKTCWTRRRNISEKKKTQVILKRLARMSFLVFTRINCYTELEKSMRESIQK